MGLDKDSIEKRVSRIELDIDHMNQMIDENLKLNEAGNRLEQDAREHHAEDKQHLSNGGAHQGESPKESSVKHSIMSTYPEQDGDGSITVKNNLQKSSESGVVNSLEAPHESQDVSVTRSRASNEEHHDWSEGQQKQGEQTSVTGQNETDVVGNDKQEYPKDALQASKEYGPHYDTNVQLDQRWNAAQYAESNDDWEDEVDESDPEPVNDNKDKDTNEDKFQSESTANSTPQLPQVATLSEQDIPRAINHETQPKISPETLSDTKGKEQETESDAPTTYLHPEDNDNHQPTHELNAQTSSRKEHFYEIEQGKGVSNPPKAVESEGAHEDESLEYSYEPAHQNSPGVHKRTMGETQDTGDNSDSSALSDTKKTAMSQNTLGEKFNDSLYDTYDQPGLPKHQEISRESDSPQDRVSVGPYSTSISQNDPYDYSYETFETSEPIPPQTANTSRDSSTGASNPFINDRLHERSTSGSTDTDDSIHIPKNSAQKPATTSNTPVSSRHPTNPFRVVSVGVVGPDGRTSRKTSAGTFSSYRDSQTDGAATLQRKLDHLVKKCAKLQKEIDYLNNMNSSSSLPIEDSRKLSRAIDKLQEYLDKKNKEKYDVGVLLSRQLRREIDRGENGQFWVGTK